LDGETLWVFAYRLSHSIDGSNHGNDALPHIQGMNAALFMPPINRIDHVIRQRFYQG
jgi:hypothetical protein